MNKRIVQEILCVLWVKQGHENPQTLPNFAKSEVGILLKHKRMATEHNMKRKIEFWLYEHVSCDLRASGVDRAGGRERIRRTLMGWK